MRYDLGPVNGNLTRPITSGVYAAPYVPVDKFERTHDRPADVDTLSLSPARYCARQTTVVTIVHAQRIKIPSRPSRISWPAAMSVSTSGTDYS